jgi:P27 family predicted phage terminase small subunit
MLAGMGVLSRIDRNAIIRYCTDLSRWKKLQQFLAKNGEVYPIRDGNGKIKCFAAFPHVSIANKLALLLTKFEQEFGMTPSARTRIECNVEDAESQTIEEYLKHRYFEERFMGKPENGISASDVLDLLEKAKPLPELKIDRRGEPGFGKPADEDELD